MLARKGPLPYSGVAEGPLGIVTAVEILNRQLDELRVVALEPDSEQGDLLEGFVIEIAPEMLEPCPRRRFGGLGPSCRTGSRYCMQYRRRFGGRRRYCCFLGQLHGLEEMGSPHDLLKIAR